MTTEFPHPSAAYLALLTPDIQDLLVDLIRTTAGMSEEEKEHALTAMVGCAEALFEHTVAKGVTNLPLRFMTVAGDIIGAIHDHATKAEVA